MFRANGHCKHFPRLNPAGYKIAIEAKCRVPFRARGARQRAENMSPVGTVRFREGRLDPNPLAPSSVLWSPPPTNATSSLEASREACSSSGARLPPPMESESPSPEVPHPPGVSVGGRWAPSSCTALRRGIGVVVGAGAVAGVVVGGEGAGAAGAEGCSGGGSGPDWLPDTLGSAQ